MNIVIKRTPLYGIGNALVDVIVRVEDAFLTDNGLEKGQMRLLTTAEQGALLLKIGGAGRTLQSGGSAANTLVSFCRFGGTGGYACQVGRDDFGDFFVQDLDEAGIAYGDGVRVSGSTGTCLVLVTPDGERTLCTDLGVSAGFSTETLSVPRLMLADALYMEGYLLCSPNGTAAVLSAQQVANDNGAVVALSLSDVSVVDMARDRLADVLSNGVQLLFCNAAEAAAYTGLSGEKAIEALNELVQYVVVTQGPAGAWVRDGKTVQKIAANNVEVVDTNGAGDTFAAGFLYSLYADGQLATGAFSRGLDAAVLRKAATFGYQAAEKLVQQLGPRLDVAACSTLAENRIT